MFTESEYESKCYVCDRLAVVLTRFEGRNIHYGIILLKHFPDENKARIKFYNKCQKIYKTNNNVYAYPSVTNVDAISTGERMRTLLYTNFKIVYLTKSQATVGIMLV